MTIAEAYELAQELDESDAAVTTWEAGFLESILTREERGLGLTGPQVETIEKMGEKYL